MRRWTVACINWTHPDAPHAAVYLNINGSAELLRFFGTHQEAIDHAHRMASATIPTHADRRRRA